MPKPFSLKWYYLTHSWEDKGVHTFPKGICPKGNVIARLEYELAYYDFAVNRFNHYTTRTFPFISYVCCCVDVLDRLERGTCMLEFGACRGTLH